MTEKTINMVTITEEEYKALKKDSAILAALYAGGVQDWDWYGESVAEVVGEEDYT